MSSFSQSSQPPGSGVHRRHSASGYLSPSEYETMRAENAQAAVAV